MTGCSLAALKRRLRGRAACAVLLALALAFWPIGVSGDTSPWSSPVKISEGTQGGWFPTVAADPTGAIHVVWNGSVPGAKAGDAPGRDNGAAVGASRIATTDMTSALLYARWDGKTWTKPNDVGLAWRGVALRPALVADQNGQLHLLHNAIGRLEPDAYTLIPNIYHTVSPASSAERVQSWRESVKMTWGLSYYSDVAIDSRGTLHAIWTEASAVQDSAGRDLGYGIYYARSVDGGQTWSRRVPLDGQNSIWWYRLQLKVDARDRLHVVWETLDSEAPSGFGVTSAAYYAQSVDGGLTWYQTRLLDDSSAAVPAPAAGEAPAATPVAGAVLALSPQQPCIGVTGDGRILLLYRQPTTNRILYRESADGRKWSTGRTLPGVRVGVGRPYDRYDAVTDSAGHVHVAVVGYATDITPQGLLHLEWNGQEWGPVSTISSSPPYPEFPRLAVTEGNRIHAVWFDGDVESVDRVPVGIWYSSATSSAPAVPSKPSSVALAVGGLARDVTPTVVPTPTVGQRAGLFVAGGPVAAEPHDISPIELFTQHPAFPVAAGLGPVLFGLALFVVVGARRSR
jgi:hypothetical protein